MNQNVGKYTMDSMDPMGYDLKRNEIFEVIRGTWHMSPKEACLNVRMSTKPDSNRKESARIVGHVKLPGGTSRQENHPDFL